MANLFDGPFAWFVGAVMARMNRDAEIEAIEMLSPGPKDAVLVVGFGPGVGVGLLAERLAGGSVVGVDPAAAMVRNASRRNQAQIRSGKVALQATTADAIAAPDRHFDGALAVNALMLCEPFEKTARELARVLKPGASLVSLTHDWALERRSGSVSAWLAMARQALEAAGFGEVRSSPAKAERGRAVALTARRL